MTRDEARRLLAAAGVADPGGDARRLFEFACRREGGPTGPVDPDRPDAGTLAIFRRAVEARAGRMPLSQIVGGRAFWKGWFLVTPDVLDPRPDTEILVEQALKVPFSRVLDLGTGSGCILISLLAERPGAVGLGTDISDRALLVAGKNAIRHGVADRLELTVSDWFADIGGRYDLIVANPPYIAAEEMAGLDPEVRDHEPRQALTDGADGLSACRRIVRGAPGHLDQGGRLIVEIGPSQGAAVAGLFREAGFRDVAVHPDLDGRDRVVSGHAPA